MRHKIWNFENEGSISSSPFVWQSAKKKWWTKRFVKVHTWILVMEFILKSHGICEVREQSEKQSF